MHAFAQKQNQQPKHVSSNIKRSSTANYAESHKHYSIPKPQHKILGNQEIQLQQANAVDLEYLPSTKEANRFAHDFSKIPVHPKSPANVQAKLTVNTPGDVYEQEGDRVADQVLAAPTHSAVEGAPSRIQRFAGHATRQVDTAPTSVDHALANPGRPLEPALRQDMEQRFGHDFSRVLVHSGAAAEQSAWDLNAHAYTVGHNIVFGAGQFAPGTFEGRRLIVHELTHVVQQGNETPWTASVPLHIDTSGEHAAELASDKVMLGQSAGHVGSCHGTSIQRQVPRLMPPTPPPAPWLIPKTFPLPPAYPVPRESPETDDKIKRGQCGSPELPHTLVSFFPGPLGQGGRVKASPLTRCPGNTIGSKPQDRFYKDQFKCIDAAGERGTWVRGHILHGETDRSGDRNLHGPGNTAANLIIIDQGLNQRMRSWIEDAVLKLVYGPFPHVLWLDAWVDSYYTGLPFFAESISVEYGPYDTRSGTEGPRWNFKQFLLREKRTPPNCPAYGFGEGAFPGRAAAASSSGFQSRLQICHRELESRVFNVAYGGLMVAINAKWVGRGPGEEAAGAEGQPEGCPRQKYRAALYKENSLAFDDWISTSDELYTGRRVVLTWRQLDDGDYYLKIMTNNANPSCCLEGDITVDTFNAPGPKSRRPPEIA